MRSFSNKEYLLATPTAKRLYGYIKDLPIIELRCYVDLDRILRNDPISNISELWLYGDRDREDLMRACGVEERYISGNASDFEKFKEFCRIMPMLCGNPHYISCHAELSEYFDCELTITPENCETIWNKTAAILEANSIGAFDYLKSMGARVLITEGTPEKSPEVYKSIREQSAVPLILPVLCADGCFNINKRNFSEYISQIAKQANTNISDLDSFCQALRTVIDGYADAGCRSAYHKITSDYSFSRPDKHHAELVLKKSLSGRWADITKEDLGLWKTQLLRFFGIEYTRRGWLLEIEMDSATHIETQKALEYMSSNSALPTVLIHSDNNIGLTSTVDLCNSVRSAAATSACNVLQCIRNTVSDAKQLELTIKRIAGKTALGSIAAMSGGYCGFRTKSMHELFRKNLCNVAGEWVDIGICDEHTAVAIIKQISYENLADRLSF